METKWTPGEWRVESGLVYALDEFETANRFSARIEGGFETNYRRDPVRTSDEEVRANAHLIAAAPCMAQYIRLRAEAGDCEAQALWERLNGR